MLNYIPYCINGRAVAGRGERTAPVLIQLPEVRCRGCTSTTLMLFAGSPEPTIRSRGLGVAPTFAQITNPASSEPFGQNLA